MKAILAIKLHSIIDVITNSSSEIFVLDTDKSIDTIKEILQYFHEVIMSASSDHDKEYYGTLEDCIDIFVANKGTVKEYEDYKEYYNVSVKEGDLVIESTQDNSIPCTIADFIEDKFNAKCWYIG